MPKALGHDDVIEDATVLDGEAEDISAMQDDIDREMQDIFKDVGGDPEDVEFDIRVKKVEKNTGKAAHCFSATPQELPLTERIKDEYGPGVYQIWVYKNGRRFRKRELRIANTIEKPASKILAENKQDIASLISTMMEQQRQSLQQMQDMLTRQVQPVQAGNQMEQMTIMLGVMNQMKEFLTPQSQGNQMDGLIKGIQLAKDLAGKDGDTNINDVILSVVKDFAPPLLEITKKTREAQQAKMPPPNQPQPNPQQVTDQTGAPQMSPEQQKITEEFRGHVSMLVNMARADADPGLWAEVVHSRMSPQDLQELIPRSDVMDVLAAYDPGVKEFLPWFTELREHLKSMMQEDGIWPLQPEPVPQASDVMDENLTPQAESIINGENNSESITGVEPVTIEDAATNATRDDSTASQDT